MSRRCGGSTSFFAIKESDTLLVEETEWDPQEFERHGLSRFIDSYAGFKS